MSLHCLSRLGLPKTLAEQLQVKLPRVYLACHKLKVQSGSALYWIFSKTIQENYLNVLYRLPVFQGYLFTRSQDEVHLSGSVISKMVRYRGDIGDIKSVTVTYDKSSLSVGLPYPNDWHLTGASLWSADKQTKWVYMCDSRPWFGSIVIKVTSENGFSRII